MLCPALHSGERFLATALAHIDCQAQGLGSYGYGALADPGSAVSMALASLLTLFIAFFGIRLLMGYEIAGRDIINDVLKIGIVLTLATSWPAWRVLGYDLFINGPTEVARAVGLAAGLPGSSGDFAGRLQRIDTGLSALNVFGSGRLGVAQGDWFQLGLARSAYLIGTLAPLALVKLATGILLAIAPLVAGLMLFGMTRPIFAGWAKGLVATFIASMSLTLVYGAQMALLEPWLQDALRRRQSEQSVLDAPVEIVVVTLAFAIVALGVVALSSRIAFHGGGWIGPHTASSLRERAPRAADRRETSTSVHSNSEAPLRAHTVAAAVGESLRREERLSTMTRGLGAVSPSAPSSASSGSAPIRDPIETLGGSYRRGARRVSASGQRRDKTR